MIKIRVIGDTEVIDRIRRVDSEREVMNAFHLGLLSIVAKSKEHYLTGAALRVRTGRLRGSVRPTEPRREGGMIVGEVGTLPLKYAPRWEFGLKNPVVIRPKKARALKIPTATGIIFRMRATLKPDKGRPYLLPAIADTKDKLLELLGAALGKAVGAGK